MAMRSASAAAKLFAGRLCATEEVAGGSLSGSGLCGRGLKAILFGDGLSRVAAHPAIVRATGAAANGGRRLYCFGRRDGLPAGGKNTRGPIDHEKLKHDLAEEASSQACRGMKNCPHAKTLNLEVELKVERALAAHKRYTDQNMNAWKRDQETTIANIRCEVESKLKNVRKDWQLEFSGLRRIVDKLSDVVKVLEDKCAILTQRYEFFKDSFEYRIQCVQFNVVKVIAGVATVCGGCIVSYYELKKQLLPRPSQVNGNPVTEQAFAKDWWD